MKEMTRQSAVVDAFARLASKSTSEEHLLSLIVERSVDAGAVAYMITDSPTVAMKTAATAGRDLGMLAEAFFRFRKDEERKGVNSQVAAETKPPSFIA